MFWELSPRELEELLKRRREEERRESLLFGLVASVIVNVNRVKGKKAVQPGDFFREKPKDSDFMKPEEAARFMDKWAKARNARHVATQQSESGGAE